MTLLLSCAVEGHAWSPACLGSGSQHTHTWVLQTLAGPQRITSQGQGTLCPRTGVRRGGEAGASWGSQGPHRQTSVYKERMAFPEGGPGSSRVFTQKRRLWWEMAPTPISCHPRPSSPGSSTRPPLLVAPGLVQWRVVGTTEQSQAGALWRQGGSLFPAASSQPVCAARWTDKVPLP